MEITLGTFLSISNNKTTLQCYSRFKAAMYIASPEKRSTRKLLFLADENKNYTLLLPILRSQRLQYLLQILN
jgi:hypothetical protein